MKLNELTNAGSKITEQLEKIRTDVGANLGTHSAKSSLKIDFIEGVELQNAALQYPEEPIIKGGKFYMVYIRDHYYYTRTKSAHDNEVNKHPDRRYLNGNKIHFYYCTKLQQMSSAGKRKRYRPTTRYTSECRIDLCDASNISTRLAFCKYCVKILCGNSSVYEGKYKFAVAEYGDAKNLMDCVKKFHSGNGLSVVRQDAENFLDHTLHRANTARVIS